ncbi:MAG: protein kinase [Planctomycetota bacterium]
MRRSTALLNSALRLGVIRRNQLARFEADYQAECARDSAPAFDIWFTQRLTRNGTAGSQASADAAATVAAFRATPVQCTACGAAFYGAQSGKGPVLLCPQCHSTHVRISGEPELAAASSSATATAATRTGMHASSTATRTHSSGTATLPEPGRMVGGCRITGALGSASFGKLMTGVQTASGQPVRVAVIDRERLGTERFTRISRELAALAGSAIVGVEPIVAVQPEGDDRLVVITRRAAGARSLREALARQGRLPLAIVVSHGLTLARALNTVHGRGVVHRHINGETVLLAGTAQIADFGLAPRHICSRDINRDGQVNGGPSCLAPELISGASVDSRADTYSLGCVLWMMLAGQAPFRGSGDEVLLRHMSEPLPPLPAVVSAENSREAVGRMQDLIKRMTALRPANRPTGMSTVERDLQRVIDPTAVSPGTAGAVRGNGDAATTSSAALQAMPSVTSRRPVSILAGLPDPRMGLPMGDPQPTRRAGVRSPWRALIPAAVLLLLAWLGWMLFGGSGKESQPVNMAGAGANTATANTPIGLQSPETNAATNAGANSNTATTINGNATSANGNSASSANTPANTAPPTNSNANTPPANAANTNTPPANNNAPANNTPATNSNTPDSPQTRPAPVDPDARINEIIARIFAQLPDLDEELFELATSDAEVRKRLIAALNTPDVPVRVRQHLPGVLVWVQDAATLRALLSAARNSREVEVRESSMTFALSLIRSAEALIKGSRADILATTSAALRDVVAMRHLGLAMARVACDPGLIEPLAQLVRDASDTAVQQDALQTVLGLVKADLWPEPQPALQAAVYGRLLDGNRDVRHLALHNMVSFQLRGWMLERGARDTAFKALRQLVDTFRGRGVDDEAVERALALMRLLVPANEVESQIAYYLSLVESAWQLPQPIASDTAVTKATETRRGLLIQHVPEVVARFAKQLDTANRRLDVIMATWSDAAALSNLRASVRAATGDGLDQLVDTLLAEFDDVRARILRRDTEQSRYKPNPDTERFIAELRAMQRARTPQTSRVIESDSRGGWPQLVQRGDGSDGGDDPGQPLQLLDENPARWLASSVSSLDKDQDFNLDSGRLRIIYTRWAESAVVRVLDGFMRHYPTILIEGRFAENAEQVRAALAAGTADIGLMVSDPTRRDDYLGKASEQRPAEVLQLLPIAMVGVRLAVRDIETQDNVSREDLQRIFGGATEGDARLATFTPTADCAVTGYLRAWLGTDLAADKIAGGNTAAQCDLGIAVALRGGSSIGALGLLPAKSELYPGLKMLRVNGVRPTPSSIRSGQYPLCSPVLIADRGDGKRGSPVELFRQFALSTRGQRLLRDAGAYPLRPMNGEFGERTWQSLLPMGLSFDQSAHQLDPGNTSNEPVRIFTQSDVFPIANNAAMALQRLDNQLPIQITRGSGDAAGGENPVVLTTDADLLRRPVDGLPWQSQAIAYEALVLIVHPNNTITNLSRSDLAAVLTGEKWSGLGGIQRPTGAPNRSEVMPLGEIHRIGLSASADQLVARSAMANPAPLRVTAARAQTAEAVMEAVAADENAIGWVPLHLVDRRKVKVLQINGVEPTRESVQRGKWLIARPVLLGTRGVPRGSARIFADFMHSRFGQAIVEALGYVRFSERATFAPIVEINGADVLVRAPSEWRQSIVASLPMLVRSLVEFNPGTPLAQRPPEFRFNNGPPAGDVWHTMRFVRNDSILEVQADQQTLPAGNMKMLLESLIRKLDQGARELRFTCRPAAGEPLARVTRAVRFYD